MKAFEEVNKSQSQFCGFFFFSCQNSWRGLSEQEDLQYQNSVLIKSNQACLCFEHLNITSVNNLSQITCLLYLGTTLQCNSHTFIPVWWNNHVKGQWQWWHWLEAKSGVADLHSFHLICIIVWKWTSLSYSLRVSQGTINSHHENIQLGFVNKGWQDLSLGNVNVNIVLVYRRCAEKPQGGFESTTWADFKDSFSLNGYTDTIIDTCISVFIPSVPVLTRKQWLNSQL